MSVIKTVRSRFKLFKQPYKVGAVIGEANDLLILGIGRFEITYDTLHVWYACQDLSATNSVSKQQSRNVTNSPRGVEMHVTVKYDDQLKLDQLQLGSLHTINGQVYKMLEYDLIELRGTDLYIEFTARIIHPIGQQEAKAKQRDARRKRLKLEIVSP